MFKNLQITLYTICITILCSNSVIAQGLHFSQFFNAPLLLSPANAALMPESDYRVGVNYRTQWKSIPVPFNTFSAYGDFQLMRNSNNTNWMGIGAGVFNDRAGDGILSLTKVDVMLAYHVQMGEYSMISAGAGVAYVQRSVDFNRLSYDLQWDDFTFNRDLSNGETYSVQKTTYPDVTAGVNYSYFPSEELFLKVGVGMLHINRPVESFYRQDNKLGMRPTGNFEIIGKISEKWIAHPAIYYTYQRKASELVMGSQFAYNVNNLDNAPSIFYVGAYYRVGDALVTLAGFEWNKLRLTGTVDITMSAAKQAIRGSGAFELSLIYQGLYDPGSINRNGYNCPRF